MQANLLQLSNVKHACKVFHQGNGQHGKAIIKKEILNEYKHKNDILKIQRRCFLKLSHIQNYKSDGT